MRKLTPIVALLLLAGCKGQSAALTATDTLVNGTAGPAYQWYVENDADLDSPTRSALLRELWSARSFVAEAKGQPQPTTPMPAAVKPAWKVKP